MRRWIALSLFLTFFVGCAEYSLDEANRVFQSYRGTIVDVQKVQIAAGSSGGALGGIVGLIVGSQIGEGKGNVAATLAGGVIGSLLGSHVATKGERLLIALDDGSEITTIIKGDYPFYVGERVRLILDGKKIIKIEPLR